MENKPASLLAVPLGKALCGIPPSWCGRQIKWLPKMNELLSELVQRIDRFLVVGGKICN